MRLERQWSFIIAIVIVSSQATAATSWNIKTFTNGNAITDLILTDTHVWSVTTGGLVRWNLTERTYEKFTTQDGLGDNWFVCGVVDVSGVLWFGSLMGGLHRFDGASWQRITTTDGIPDNNISALAVDASNRLWVGFGAALGNGLGKKENDQWTFFTAQDGLNHNFINALLPTRMGLWIGSRGGVNLLTNDHIVLSLTTAQGLPSNMALSLAIQNNQSLWIGTDQGVAVFDGVNCVVYTTAEGLPDNTIQSICIDEENRVWVGTKKGIARWDGESWIVFGREDGLCGENISSLAQASDGRILVGVYNRCINVLENDVVIDFYKTDDWLPDNEVRALAFEGDVLWFGTAFGGVGWFDGVNGYIFDPEESINSSIIRCMAIDAIGNKWFGTFGQGVFMFNGTSWSNYSSANGLPDDRVMGIYIDSENSKWFATWGGGIASLSDRGWLILTADDGLADNRTYDVTQDQTNAYWFSTDSGVTRYDGQSMVSYYEADGLIFHRVYTAFADYENILWFGACKGLSRFNGASFTNYYETDGLAHYRVRDIFSDPEQNLWLATGGGINRFDRVSFLTIAPLDGFAGYETYVGVQSENGTLAFGSEGGISLLQRIPPPPNHQPVIVAAGCRYEPAEVTGTFIFESVVLDEDSDSISVELCFEGAGLGIFLNDNGTDGDTAAGDAIFSIRIPVSAHDYGVYPIELKATDTEGNNAIWPYLQVDQ